jgi:anti-anti-sigma factor
VLERQVIEAFDRGRRVILLAESTDDQQLSDLFGRTGYGSREGQVDIRAAADVYLARGGFDSDTMLGLLEGAKLAALDDGFTGVHFIGDLSWAASDPRALDRLPAYERALRAVYSDERASGLCQYDRTRFRGGTIASCAAAHAVLETAFEETDTLEDDRVTIAVGRHGSVRARGEIDIANAHLFEEALAIAEQRSDDVCVDASGLTFIDVRGVTVLFDAARSGSIALLAAQSPLRGMLEAFDAHRQLPGLRTD